MVIKAFTAGLGVETNSFSKLRTGFKDFENTFLFPPYDHPDSLTEVSAPLYILRHMGAENGWIIKEGTYAFALPGGRVEREIYENLRDRILHELKSAMPIDMVAMSLHGAMCADGYDDCEGDLLCRIRQLVGNTVPIGAEIDPHAHLSPLMVENADILVAFKEYPHTDFLERGQELITILRRCVISDWRPEKAVFDCRTIGRFHTTRQPMRGLVDEIKATEGQDGVVSISIIHCFPWGDVADAGTKILVYADTKNSAEKHAYEFGKKLIAIREYSYTKPVSIENAIDAVLKSPNRRFVFADVADNPGGGASGNNVTLLNRLINANIEFCLGPFFAPEIVKIAHEKGLGNAIKIKLNLDEESEMTALITGFCHNAVQSWSGTQMTLGDMCSLQIGKGTVAVSSIRDQAYSPDLFTSTGINPNDYRIIVVKSAQHFAAGFGALCDEIIYVGGGGELETDFRKVPYEKIKRPIWPLDND